MISDCFLYACFRLCVSKIQVYIFVICVCARNLSSTGVDYLSTLITIIIIGNNYDVCAQVCTFLYVYVWKGPWMYSSAHICLQHNTPYFYEGRR